MPKSRNQAFKIGWRLKEALMGEKLLQFSTSLAEGRTGKCHPKEAKWTDIQTYRHTYVQTDRASYRERESPVAIYAQNISHPREKNVGNK